MDFAAICLFVWLRGATGAAAATDVNVSLCVGSV